MMLSCVAPLFFLCIAIAQGLQNCSQLYGFIQVRGQSITQKTLVSKHALFPPHSYEWITWTKLVTLSTTEDPCVSSTALSTNITNKIVLLFEAVGNCSAQQKVYRAQENGAKAVLISNADVSGIDVSISSDAATVFDNNVSIPMRSISALEANLLSDEIIAARNVEVQIGCNNASIPSTLCLTESSPSPSDYGWVSGNYQRQDPFTVNGHPFWLSSGIPGYRNPHQIYLHIGDGNGDWYWAVADVFTFNKEYETAIVLRCTSTGSLISNPLDCPQWESTKDEGTTWSTMPANVSHGLCPTIESHSVCISSTKYNLHGISGTYSQKIPGETMWFRQLTECDTRSARLSFIETGYFGTNYFELKERLNKWDIAICFVANETVSVNKWKATLCNEWKVLNDLDLRYFADHREVDATFSISSGSCSEKIDCVASTAPDVMCFANNSVLHGGAMGEYVKLDEVGPTFGSPIYKRVAYEENPLYVEASYGTSVDFYIWYTNEVWAEEESWVFDYREWTMSTTNLTSAIEAGDYDDSWGHCQGYAYGNPFACRGWIFYSGTALHYDEEMSVTDSQCLVEPFPLIPSTWSEYICVAFHNTSDENAAKLSILNSDQLRGAFVVDTSSISSASPVPNWIKDRNDYESQQWWIWWWEGWTLYQGETWVAYCDPFVAGASADPIACKTWYDKQYTQLTNIYLYECTADDVLTLTPNVICASSSSNSYLQGVYVDDGINANEYDTIEFILSADDDDSDPLYLWYHDSKWWISPIDYKSKSNYDPSEVDVYAFCPGGLQDENTPFCEDCWSIFWDSVPLDSYATSLWFEDCSFSLNRVEADDDGAYDCAADIIYTGDVAQRDSLCINKLDGDDDDGLYGEYQLVADGLYEKDGWQITHNKVTNYWMISNDLSEYLFICMSDAQNGWLPSSQCYDGNDLFSIDETCDDDGGDGDDDDSQGKKSKGGGGGKVAGIVIGILLALICLIAIIYLWFKKEQSGKHQRVVHEETEIVGGKQQEANREQAQYDMGALNPNADDDPLTA